MSYKTMSNCRLLEEIERYLNYLSVAEEANTRQYYLDKIEDISTTYVQKEGVKRLVKEEESKLNIFLRRLKDLSEETGIWIDPKDFYEEAATSLFIRDGVKYSYTASEYGWMLNLTRQDLRQLSK